VGHIRYLSKASFLGDILVVGLNSDKSIQKIKDSRRPIIPQEQRAEILAGLEAVDYVIIFDEETPLNLINKLLPQVLVKGADWDINKIVGKDEVEAWGGSVHALKWVEGFSTTKIIETICTRFCPSTFPSKDKKV